MYTSGEVELCNHYCQFGTCKHESRCRYVHDRSKVALCRMFLRNECPRSADACNLIHEADPNRTPECGLFLRQLCVDPACKYLHVKKASDAEDCELFRKSWCPSGVSCPKRHYIPPATEKRPREEDAPASSEDEEEQLRRIWDTEPTLKVYL